MVAGVHRPSTHRLIVYMPYASYLCRSSAVEDEPFIPIDPFYR